MIIFNRHKDDCTMNALHTDHMTAAERLAEIAQILARGLMRLRARQSSQLSGDRGDSCLDCSPHQRRHAPVAEPTETMP